ncbi:MAG: hypothetical protein IJQ31_12175 [Thermoguttaceae bacterium]|nr:hypothetical protein [Thermoguttaceae bacterium]
MKRTSYLKRIHKKRRQRILETLHHLRLYMQKFPEVRSEEVKVYLRRRIGEMQVCGTKMPSKKRNFCRSVCFCDLCIHVKKKGYVKQIDKFLQKEKTPLYMFVRKERFVDKILSPQDIDKRLKYLEKQRTKINRSMISGMAKVDGVIHRIEVLPLKNRVVTCLTTLFVTRKPKVVSDSYFWKGFYTYDDHPDHKANRKKLGIVVSNKKEALKAIHKVFKSRVGIYTKADYDMLLDLIVLMKRRHIWTSGGKMFKQEK